MPASILATERSRVTPSSSGRLLKQLVTMRLDADLLEWLRQERGYQTRINAILRSYMDAHKKRA